MKTETTTPSEPTGTKLTEEIYNAAMCILKEEGGDIHHILATRFNVYGFNRYNHYYGYNKPID